MLATFLAELFNEYRPKLRFFLGRTHVLSVVAPSEDYLVEDIEDAEQEGDVDGHA